MPMTVREIVKLLKQNGFKRMASNGSHQKFYNPETNKTTIVPVHSGELKPGTEASILKQAGLK